ncbi:MAG: universal stress protein [Pseudomonadota bacterium]
MTLNSIFVPFLRPDDHNALCSAFSLAEGLGSKRVVAAHFRQRLNPAQFAYYPFAGVMPLDNDDTLLKAEEKLALEMKEMFEDVRSKARVSTQHGNGSDSDEAMTALLRDQKGLIPEDVATVATGFDVTVLSNAGDADTSLDLIEHVILRSGRPVILVPKSKTEVTLDHVAVAWNASAEAARAVTASMGVLAVAKKVSVVSVSDRSVPGDAVDELIETLRLNGIDAAAEQTPKPDGVSTEDLLEKHLVGINPDLVVMGAYSHSRLRESVFGGFTRSVLTRVPFPAFLAR